MAKPQDSERVVAHLLHRQELGRGRRHSGRSGEGRAGLRVAHARALEAVLRSAPQGFRHEKLKQELALVAMPVEAEAKKR